MISAAFLFPLFVAIPAGSMADRVGPKPLMLVGAGLLAAAPLLVAFASSLATLIALQILSGLGQLIAVVAAQKVVASFGSGVARERNFGWYGTFVSGGQLLGPVLAGVLVDLRGFDVAYGVAGVVAALAAVAFLLVPTQGIGRDAAEGASGGRNVTPRALLELARLPTVQVSLVVSAGVMLVLIAHGSFLPAFLDELAVPASVIGLILSARSFASIVVRPVMARVITLLGGRVRTFLANAAASAVGLAGLALGDQLVVLVAASLLLGLSIGIAQPLTMVTVVEEVPTHGHGVAFGARITANRLVQFVTPLLLGLVAQAFGYAPMLLVAGVAVAIPGAVLLGRRQRYAVIDDGVR